MSGVRIKKVAVKTEKYIEYSVAYSSSTVAILTAETSL
jgi:hypothetical protein